MTVETELLVEHQSAARVKHQLMDLRGCEHSTVCRTGAVQQLELQLAR